MFCSHRIWLKPSMDALTRKHNLKQTLDTFRQWTVTKGTESRKPLMLSTREQLRKYTEMKRSLAASSTSEASRRSTRRRHIGHPRHRRHFLRNDITIRGHGRCSPCKRPSRKQSHVPHGTLKIRAQPLVLNNTKTRKS